MLVEITIFCDHGGNTIFAILVAVKDCTLYLVAVRFSDGTVAVMAGFQNNCR